MPKSSYRTSRFWCLARLLGKTAGKNALRNSLLLYLTAGIGAFVVFAGSGLDARTVVKLSTDRPLFGVALTMLWVLATLPVARALLGSPETFFLRALPVARFEFLLVLGAGLAFAHAPWSVLWWRGAGPSSAAAATLVALAIEVHVIAGVRGAEDVVTAALVVVALGLGPSLVAALIAAPAFAIALRRAWLRAPEPRSIGRHSIWARSPPFALGSALALSVYRGHSSVILRALLFALAACAFVVLGVRNNQVSDPGTIARVSLMVWGPACVFGAAGIAGPVLSAEARASWILDACGVSAWLRSATAAGGLGAWAALLGAAYAAVVGEGLGLAAGLRALLVLENAAGGAAWAALAMSIVRMTRSAGGSDSGRLLLRLSALCVGSAVLLAIQPAVTLALMLVLAALLAARAARVPSSA